jgi:large subunit ribosomal protein L18
MKSMKRITVRYRRKREGKTNYKKRLELLKGRTDRLVVRKTNTQMIIQVARYEADGDKILLTVNSNELKKLGWKHSCKNIPAAYLAGLLAAKKAKQKGITAAILDLGLQTPLRGSKLFAVLKGAKEGGLEVPANEEVYPSDNRIKGEHISTYLAAHKSIGQDMETVKKEILK